MTTISAMILVSLIFLSCETESDRPPVGESEAPIEHVGACPFECCTYRDWTTTKPTSLRESRSLSAPVVASLEPEEPVTGVTGVVVTDKPGRVRVLDAAGAQQDVYGSDLQLHEGDVLLTLHYQGEGTWLASFAGKRFSLFLADTPGGFHAGEYTSPVRVESWPETHWWVKVKTADGREGWTDEPNHFSGKDACS